MAQNPTTPNPTHYLGNQVHLAAQLSALVYEPPNSIRTQCKMLLPQAQVQINSYKKYNSRLLVLSSASDIYIIFRGTVFKSWASWQANFTIKKTRWLSGQVHSGFLALIKQARISYNQVINRQPQARIHFAGHSQGGAAAFLATAEKGILQHRLRLASCISFGQPRAANKAFVRTGEKRLGAVCTRVTNSGDPVVGLPPVILGYDHFRFSYSYTRGQVTRRQQPPGATWVGLPLVWRHFIKAYAGLANKNKNINL